MEGFKLNSITKIKDGKYLKNYELNYTNKVGEPKIYEMVSYRNISEPSDIGSRVGGAVVVALNGDRILLLHEFRMAVNSFVYNMVAGFKEPGETMEDCVRRELYEESGLKLVRIREILRPAFAAVALSDVSNQLVIADVEGEISDHTENDELIRAAFFSKEEVRKLIEEEPFTSRAQFVAYAFCHGFFDDKE
ncbi:ADP-ribose pyrophosphatase [Lachnospiraceae bacterium XBB2008]|nr:ADP-ribose pyrophosphatase [Lachnospiraceae bacterium XBB2008]